MASICIRSSQSYVFSPAILLKHTRNYAFKSDLTIKWKRPEKILCIRPEKSGDLKPIATVDLKQFPLEFQKSVELQNAPELVRRIFSLEFATRKKIMELPREDLVDLVRRHSLDKGSMEARIASLTWEVRNLQQHMETDPRDQRTKVHLKEMIDKRKKYLKYLRRWDYKRFEWVLERLDLVYKSPPSDYTWVTRKGSLRKLTDKHCEDMRKERLDAYRVTLEAEQRDFLVKKVETLEWIREEEQACGVEESVKQEEIEAVLEQIKQLDEREKKDETKSM